jgi:hypothetical protein
MVAEGVFTMGALTSYCTVDEVVRLVSGYDTGAIGDDEALRVRIRQLLSPTRAAIDSEAGRDFLQHLDDEVQCDGTGGNAVVLSQFGIAPVQAVLSLSVSDSEVPVSEWVCYADAGLVKLRPGGSLAGSFPVGVGNVSLRVDWGYPTPPGDIGLGQAKLIAAQVLSEVAGVRGSVESMRLGDYSVSYDSGGENAGVIRRWVDDARRVAGSYRQMRFVVV